MFANVIVGVDGSPTGRDAVKLALALADEGAKITLAHIYGGVPTPGRSVATPGDRAGATAELLL